MVAGLACQPWMAFPHSARIKVMTSRLECRLGCKTVPQMDRQTAQRHTVSTILKRKILVDAWNKERIGVVRTDNVA
jgi:hypothetical protein